MVIAERSIKLIAVLNRVDYTMLESYPDNLGSKEILRNNPPRKIQVDETERVASHASRLREKKCKITVALQHTIVTDAFKFGPSPAATI